MAERIRTSTGESLAERVRWARRPIERARGLIGGPALASEEALIIDGAHQVHTFGLSSAIDVVFCDARWNVLHVVRSMRPRRIGRWVSRAHYVVELPARAAGSVEPGQRLIVS